MNIEFKIEQLKKAIKAEDIFSVEVIYNSLISAGMSEQEILKQLDLADGAE